jgi:hypothetical protein
MTGFLTPLTYLLLVLLMAPLGPAPQSPPGRPELAGLLDFESATPEALQRVQGAVAHPCLAAPSRFE